MGLFDSEYRTSVSAVTSRVISDALLPDSKKTAVVEALLKEGDVVDYVLDGLIGSVGIRAERMYEYGKKTYTFGVPRGTLVTPEQGANTVLGVIRSISTPTATVDYYHYGVLNHQHYAWFKLATEFGYSEETNQIATITATLGTPVYLQDMYSVVTDATAEEVANGSLRFWGSAPMDGVTFERRKAVTTGTRQVYVALPEPHYETQEYLIGVTRGYNPLIVDPTAVSDYVRIYYVWQTSETAVVSGTSITRKIKHESFFDIPIAKDVDAADYFHVKYYSAGVAKYFHYKSDIGTYPELDALFMPAASALGTFFPNIYFRLNASSFSAGMGAAYTQSVALAKTIGITYDDILEGVNENPSVGSIEQALITMAVPAVTNDPIEKKYLFDFFYQAYLEAGGIGIVDDFMVVASSTWGGSTISTPITMTISDGALSTVLGFSQIHKVTRAGVLGKVGTCTSELGSKRYYYPVAAVPGGNHRDGSPAYTAHVDLSVHYYRKQITQSTYTEIQVIGLRMAYNIRGYTTLGTKADAILLVPVDHALVQNYSLTERETLYSRGLHYVFTSYQRTEVQWYQTYTFGFILLVVAVVVSINSFGADNGALIAAASAGVAGAAFQLMVVILTAIIKTAVYSYITTLFVEAVGIETAFIIAIVAALVGLGKAIKAGSIKGAPHAASLLALSSNLAQGVSAAVNNAFTKLKDEFAEFDSYKESAYKELEDASKLLENKSYLAPIFIAGEKPQDFYNRTVHAGNIGVIGIDAISSFVASALTLPTLSDSSGDFSYAA